MSSERIANATPGAPTAPSFLSNAILSNGFVYCSGQLGQTPDGKMVEGPIGKRVVSCRLCWLSSSAQRTGWLDIWMLRSTADRSKHDRRLWMTYQSGWLTSATSSLDR